MQKGTKYNESDDLNLSTWKNDCTTYWSEEILREEYVHAEENQMLDFYFNMSFRCPNGDTEQAVDIWVGIQQNSISPMS